MDDSAIIQMAWETGHFWSPLCLNGANVGQDDLKHLSPADPVVRDAIRSMCAIQGEVYKSAGRVIYSREPVNDGWIGPAVRALAEVPRCRVPDYPPPPGVKFSFNDPFLQEVVLRMQNTASLKQIGAGNWKGCHGIGNFHAAIVSVDDSRLPAFLRPLWIQVLRNVQLSYAQVGLLWIFAKDGTDILTGKQTDGHVQTNMSFVSSSDGWIGLAILGQNETCSTSPIWCRFLATYRGGNSDAAIVNQWTTLVKHELGHNCGRNHTSGGVMNPSIVNGLPVEWVPGDPSTGWLKQQFGGVLVPGSGDPPPPPPPPPLSQDVINAKHDASIAWCIQAIRDLQAKAGV